MLFCTLIMARFDIYEALFITVRKMKGRERKSGSVPFNGNSRLIPFCTLGLQPWRLCQQPAEMSRMKRCYVGKWESEVLWEARQEHCYLASSDQQDVWLVEVLSS